MANGNGPTGSEWGELRSDVTHGVEIMARVETVVNEDHDAIVKLSEWRIQHEKAQRVAKDAHDKVHVRERGVFAMITTGLGGVLAYLGLR